MNDLNLENEIKIIINENNIILEEVERMQKSVYQVMSQYDSFILKNRIVFFIIGATLTNIIWLIIK